MINPFNKTWTRKKKKKNIFNCFAQVDLSDKTCDPDDRVCNNKDVDLLIIGP